MITLCAVLVPRHRPVQAVLAGCVQRVRRHLHCRPCSCLHVETERDSVIYPLQFIGVRAHLARQPQCLLQLYNDIDLITLNVMLVQGTVLAHDYLNMQTTMHICTGSPGDIEMGVAPCLFCGRLDFHACIHEASRVHPQTGLERRAV